MTGDELRAWRKRRSLTQKDVAALLGLDRSHLGHMERGRRPIQKDYAAVLAAYERLEGQVTLRVTLLERTIARLEARLLRIESVRETSPWEDPILFDNGDQP